MPELTHNSVQQLLMVLEDTARNTHHGTPLPAAYHEAVRHVADRHGVTYQTIGDLCRRRLALSDIDEFVQLLHKWLRGDGESLRRLIKKQSSPATHSMVDSFFRDAANSEATSPATSTAKGKASPTSAAPTVLMRSEDLRIRLTPDLARRLHLAHLAGLGRTLEETAVSLLEKGFEAEKETVRRALDVAVGAT